MAAEITYWSARGDRQSAPQSIISSETRSTSGTSAQSGTTPEDAVLVSVVCVTAAIRIAYGSNPTASASSAYMSAGERLWLTARPGQKIAAIDA